MREKGAWGMVLIKDCPECGTMVYCLIELSPNTKSSGDQWIASNWKSIRLQSKCPRCGADVSRLFEKPARESLKDLLYVNDTEI
jgi:endogenous inhibitor of DNA gyrase (YacG/DUF329 family)